LNAAAEHDVFDQIDTPIGGVPPEMIMSVWDRVEPMLRKAVRDDSGYTMDSLLNELQLARMQLWVIGNFQGVVCTLIKVNPPPVPPTLWVQFLGGHHMDEWLSDWKEVMEAFAISQGCAAIEFAGRKGWNKIHEKHREYKPKWTIFRRELDG
jgi:hypothetical protein